MEIVKKHLTNGQYMTSAYPKNSIFLHHTAGLNAEGAWQWWNQTPDRVGTPFIIDRNGVIVECFDPSIWAFHLGLTNDDNFHESHSVSIELVSGGQLYEEKGVFKFYPLYPNINYYTLIPKEEVYTFNKPWRGHLYYHKYTDAQIKALTELIAYLVKLFPGITIPTPLGNFYEYNPAIVAEHSGGLWSHSTVRADKTDIFPQESLIQALEDLATTLVLTPKRATQAATSSKNKGKQAQTL